MFTPLLIIQIVVALGLIILVHELGHFLSAKMFGVRVHRFALGMGPIIVKWQRGETEYSLRWIPVGGFVDLAGEHPSAEDGADPQGLCNKPAWQRIVVFSAGVVMNGLLAIVLFTVAPLVGIWVQSPVVGDVVQDKPAAKAGIKPGDRVVAINEAPIESFEDILETIAASNAGTSFKVVVERAEPGSKEPERLVFEDVRSQRGFGEGWPMIGIARQIEPQISDMLPHSPEEQAGLKVGDLILAVNGHPVADWGQLTRTLAEGPAGPVILTIRRKGNDQDLRIDPAKLKDYKLGMLPPVAIKGVEKKGPAEKAGVKAGDRVAAINDKPWPTPDQLTDTIKSGEAGSTVRLTLWRDGAIVEAACQTEVLQKDEKPRIGIALELAVDAKPVQIGSLDPGGAADQARLKPGDVILQVNDKRADKWKYIVDDLLKAPDQPALFQIQRGPTALAATYQVEAADVKRFTMEGSLGSPLYVPLPRIVSPIKAATRGLKQTFSKIRLAYANIKQLSTGQVSTEAMAGPVGIMQFAYLIGSKGLGTSINFWAMLSVFIAVLNFLPIPPFDGGHVLFVVFDAIKGKPVSLKTRHVFWLVGWILVGLLFIFVTCQDVGRLLPEAVRRFLGL